MKKIRQTTTMIVSSLLFLAFLGDAVMGCTAPSGVGTGAGEVSVANVQATKANLSLPYLFLPLIEPFSTVLVSNFETPIQFRLLNLLGCSVYNTVAMYDLTALDIFGRDVYRICTSDLTPDELRTYEAVAVAYAFAYVAVRLIPDFLPTADNIMTNVLGLPYSYLDGNPQPGTPWGLAKSLIDEALLHAETDGWNADGSLKNTFNKERYSDFDFTDADGDEYVAYSPTGNRESVKFEKDGQCKSTPNSWFWEPLLESDNNGYFTRQEHVTPFIGFTGRLFGITEEEYLAQESPLPTYDYCDEADFVLEKTRVMASNDQQKMEVELYDNKFTSILPLQLIWSIQSGFSEFDLWFYGMALDVVMYDATMLVWRDKVLFDGIRPTTVVHEVYQDRAAMTYGGPGQGQQQVSGPDWQPYIRTMPHAEYPSGSACVCTAFVETFQELTGQDATGFPLAIEILAGSSILEPGITPRHRYDSYLQQLVGDSKNLWSIS